MDRTATMPNARAPIPYSSGALALGMVAVLSIQMIFSFMRIYLFTSGRRACPGRYPQRRIPQVDPDAHGFLRAAEGRGALQPDQRRPVPDPGCGDFGAGGAITGNTGPADRAGSHLYISPRLSGMMLSVVPLIIVLSIIYSRRIRKISRQTQDQLADSNTIVQETLEGIGNVKAFSNEWFEIGRYGNSLRQAVALAVRTGATGDSSYPSSSSVFSALLSW